MKWASPANYEYVSDKSKESFIFSLTHSDNFIMYKPEYAVRNDQSYGPTFGGGHDLHVCDKANTYRYSYTDFCSTYYN